MKIDTFHKILLIVVGVLFILLSITTCVSRQHEQAAKTYAADYKAVCDQLNRTCNDMRVLEIDMDHLQDFNDRTIQTLDSTRRALNIKTKQLRLIGAAVQTIHITDTLRLTDTIFKYPGWQLDTCLTSLYDTTCLHLSYPSMIGVKTTSRSELNVFVTNKRETIDPPKKFFLCRWLQPHHTVTTVHIEEHNPNIKLNKSVWVIPND